jgi:hypothetical protein
VPIRFALRSPDFNNVNTTVIKKKTVGGVCAFDQKEGIRVQKISSTIIAAAADEDSTSASDTLSNISVVTHVREAEVIHSYCRAAGPLPSAVTDHGGHMASPFEVTSDPKAPSWRDSRVQDVEPRQRSIYIHTYTGLVCHL